MLLLCLCIVVALVSYVGICHSGEGLHQVLETVESGLLAADDNGDVSQQEPATIDAGMSSASNETV